MSFLRWFLRWAHHKGYNPSNVHETFKPKFKGADGNAKEIIYLEWEELFNLYSFKFPPSGLRWKPCAMCFASAALPVFVILTWQNCAEAT